MILNNYYNNNSNNTNEKLVNLINDLYNCTKLSKDNFLWLLDNINYEVFPTLQDLAFKKRKEVYNDKVFIRGLIEISNYCQQDCFYCGIRKSNLKVERYRYDKDKILEIVDDAYLKGYRTIVLQGGEDKYYSDNRLVDIIKTIKNKYHDIAITLSLGERTFESYRLLKEAGANRYLLRHESASANHYHKLHPTNMRLENRIKCLYDLKKLDFQTGAGLMVGSPFQTNNDLVEDLIFLQDFQPEMIGIGPYLNHQDTPFKDYQSANLDHVLVIYSLVRLICQKALIPSTTATSSLSKKGRLEALKSGCNVIMINLSDFEKRRNYSLYENKTYLGDESKEYINTIKSDIIKAGLKIDFSIGHHIRKGI